MSRESDLDKILKFIKNTDRNHIVRTGDVLNETKFSYEYLEDLLVWLKGQGLIGYYPQHTNGEVHILENGRDFIKHGGYTWQKWKRRIAIFGSIITFILVFLTFLMQCDDYRLKKRQEFKQASSTI